MSTNAGERFWRKLDAEETAAEIMRDAAPDMLAALRGLLDNPRPALGANRTDDEWQAALRAHEAAWAAAEAAITRAEGRDPNHQPTRLPG